MLIHDLIESVVRGLAVTGFVCFGLYLAGALH
jgi:hypothetical protein